MRVALLSLSLLLSGCFYSLAGADLSFEGRHKMWIENAQKNVGKNVFNCVGASPCYQYRGEGSLFLGDKVLDNGNVEAAYFGSRKKNVVTFMSTNLAQG